MNNVAELLGLAVILILGMRYLNLKSYNRELERALIHCDHLIQNANFRVLGKRYMGHYVITDVCERREKAAINLYQNHVRQALSRVKAQDRDEVVGIVSEQTCLTCTFIGGPGRRCSDDGMHISAPTGN